MAVVRTLQHIQNYPGNYEGANVNVCRKKRNSEQYLRTTVCNAMRVSIIFKNGHMWTFDVNYVNCITQNNSYVQLFAKLRVFLHLLYDLRYTSSERFVKPAAVHDILG